MNKLLIICGPTATGKTKLGIKLAKKYNGEIISADSRQVFEGMDIITGKDLSVEIPLWGLDLVKPDQKFSVAHFVEFANKVINNIWEREKLPIIVGGSGFWIKALVEGVDSIGIPPDWKLRKQLNKLSIKQLREKLKKLTPKKLRLMNKSDRNNPRRLIRAIEIASNQQPAYRRGRSTIKFDKLLIIGLKTKDYQGLYKKIDKRVEKRIKQGAEREIKNLIKQGYSWDLPSFSAAGYRLWKDYFEQKKDLKEIIQDWKYNEHQLARKQLVFFKKMKNINWFDINQLGTVKRIEKKVNRWYDKNTPSSS